MAFFTQLGFSFNPQFTDDTAACMVVSDSIYVMLLTHDKFKMFTPNPIGDARREATEVLLCLSQPDRAAVDALVRKAIAPPGVIPITSHKITALCTATVSRIWTVISGN